MGMNRWICSVAFATVISLPVMASAQNDPEAGDNGGWGGGNSGGAPGGGGNNGGGGWNNGGGGNNGGGNNGGGGWNNGQGNNGGANGGGWNNGQGNNGGANGGGWNGGDAERPNRDAAEAAEPESTESDHHNLVGHMAFGWTGFQSVPVGRVGNFSVPTVGLRYWFSDFLGLDAGLGVMYSQSGSIAKTTGTPEAETIDPSIFGMAIHLGLPLTLYHRKHYAFMVIPQVNIGFATGSDYDEQVEEDDLLSGFGLNLGAAVAAEIHFGFIGIPELSLTASVGLYLSYQSATVDDCNNAGCDNTTVTTTDSLSFGTGQFTEPWDILRSEVAARYYF